MDWTAGRGEVSDQRRRFPRRRLHDLLEGGIAVVRDDHRLGGLRGPLGLVRLERFVDDRLEQTCRGLDDMVSSWPTWQAYSKSRWARGCARRCCRAPVVGRSSRSCGWPGRGPQPRRVPPEAGVRTCRVAVPPRSIATADRATASADEHHPLPAGPSVPAGTRCRRSAGSVYPRRWQRPRTSLGGASTLCHGDLSLGLES